MNYGYCQCCKWWDTTTPSYYKGFAARCLVAEAEDYEIKHEGKTLAVASPDNDHGNGDLYTAPDFGCVQFEAKEA